VGFLLVCRRWLWWPLGIFWLRLPLRVWAFGVAGHFVALASVAGFGMLKGISVAHCFKKHQFTI